MTSENNSKNIEEIEVDESVSIDDFIKELEEKEKDLHISSEMVIEVEESEFDDPHISNTPNSMTSDQHISVPPLQSPAIHTSIPTPQPPASNKLDVSALEAEIAALKNKISKMESERSEYLENSVRRQKDFENFRNRTERERGETYVNQISNLATQMLPVLDNLNRALDSVLETNSENSKEFQQFFDGIVLVNQQVNDVLAEMGVEPIKATGNIFDPNFHEAVATEESEEHPSHTITEELLRGYKIGEKVIRPAMVKVATTPSIQETTPEKSSTEDQI